jgi:hypothetical protein
MDITRASLQYIQGNTSELIYFFTKNKFTAAALLAKRYKWNRNAEYSIFYEQLSADYCNGSY